MDKSLSQEWRVAAQLLAELAHEIQVWADGGVPSPPRAPAPLALALSAGRPAGGHRDCGGDGKRVAPRRSAEFLRDCPVQTQNSPA